MYKLAKEAIIQRKFNLMAEVKKMAKGEDECGI